MEGRKPQPIKERETYLTEGSLNQWWEGRLGWKGASANEGMGDLLGGKRDSHAK